MPIKVAVVDDHKLFRELLADHLKMYNRIDPEVEQASNGKDLLAILKDKAIDVVLLDLSMPVMSGEETVEIIMRRYPECKVIILTIDASPFKILELMRMGVHGYLLKTCDPTELYEAITSVIDKDFYQNDISVQAMEFSVEVFKDGVSTELAMLTKRETEILLKICNELTTKEISHQLSISQKTVENHRMSMLKKLGVRNTVGLVKYAYERGLLAPNHS